FLFPGLDIGEHCVPLALGDDGAEAGVLVERITGGELLGPVGELLDDLVVHGPLDEQPGARGAHLALAVEDPGLRPAHRGGAVGGVSCAGLSTTVQPAASAGATFHVARLSGKFHGTMAPTTPTGSRNVYVKKLPLTGSVSPVSLSAQPA